MMVVVLGFMLINKPKPRENVENTANNSVAEAVTETRIDSIRADETMIVYAADFLRQAGTPSTDAADNKTYTYATPNVNLTLADGKVSGTVQLNDTTSMSYDDVVASNFPEGMTLEQKSQAPTLLREALADASRYKSFARHLMAPEGADDEEISLSNNVIRLDFSRKGGIINRATLLDYFTYFPSKENPEKVDTLPVVMFKAQDAAYSFTLRTSEQDVETSEFYFTPKQLNDSTLLMSLDLGNGASWGLRYTLPQDSYVAHIDIVQNNISSVIPSSTDHIGFKWSMNMPRQERGRTFEERNSQVVYQYPGEKPDDINGMKDEAVTLENSAKWIGFKNQFFSNVIVAKTPFQRGGQLAQRKIQGDEYIKFMTADMTLDYNVTDEVPAQFDFFIGPNLYPLLNQVNDQLTAEGDQDLNLNRLVPLGWSWLRWINTLIVIPVFNFLSSFIGSYGIIILLLTLFIKILLFPLTYKSLKSQAKMRILAPEIKEINEKYPGKENAMIRQQKTMALYSKAGASPFAGCLPMLLQMPILIALFSFFPSAIELRGESFLWADNLAAPDVVLTLPFSIPFYGNHVSLFCLLMTLTNIIYTRINMQNQPSSSSMPGMKWMMYLMPLMFLFFFNDYASALSYYYFLSLLITILLTYLFRHFTDEKKLRQQMMEKAANAKPKKSGFMARLAEAQRQQQEQLRKQQAAREKNRRK